MKINTNLKVFVLALAFILVVSVSTSSLKSENQIQLGENNQMNSKDDQNVSQYKVLAMNPLIKNNQMEKFDYKLLTLTKLEAVFYEAKIPKLPTSEEKTCTKNYLFTQLYYQIQLPCIERNLICTLDDFLREYQGEDFNEMDFKIPKEIIATFGEEKARKKCLVLTYDSFDKLGDNIFICHQDSSILLEIQFKMSQLIRDVYFKNTELFVDYLPNNDPRGRVSGLLRLDIDSLKFINAETKKVTVEVPYVNIQPYPYNYHKKDRFPSKDAASDNLNDRCFKIELNTGNSEYRSFCVFYPPGDFSKKTILKPFRARWLALFYVIKIVRKIHPLLLSSSIEKMAKKKDSLEVESNEMIPATYDFRMVFILKTYEIETKLKIERKISDVDLASLYVKVKEETAHEVCRDIALCIRGLLYKIVLSILPLGRPHTVFAMDILNPYISLYPNRNIKVDKVEDGLGKTLVQEISRLKGSENYFAEEISLPVGGVPDYQAVLEAHKIFKDLKNNSIRIKSIDKIKNCAANTGIGQNLNRKMGLLPYMSEKDFLFDFLGTVGKVAESVS